MDERKRKSGVDPRGEIQKGSTSGTAVGAKLGRTKGNKQEAEYTEPEGRHGKPGRGEGEGSGKRERNRSTGEASCEAETGREWKGRTDRLSSEMLKRKRTKGSGSQALIPEEKSEREAPVERLWERSREGRKETNRELSKQNRKEADGKPAVDEGEKRRGRKEPSLDEEPTVRRSGQRAERKKQEAE